MKRVLSASASLVVLSVLFLQPSASAQSAPSSQSAMSSKFARATRAFVATWQQTFAGYGKTFPTPAFVPFEGRVTGTGCGTITENNAYYCSGDNKIYYDVNFLGVLSREVGRITGTDGDYAAIVPIGHELGHAVAHHLQGSANLHQRLSYRVNGLGQEILADCLSGVVTRGAESAGLLDRTDITEGLATVRLVGSATTTEPSLRLWIQRHSQDHPTPDSREAAFTRGFERGVGACGEITNMLGATGPRD